MKIKIHNKEEGCRQGCGCATLLPIFILLIMTHAGDDLGFFETLGVIILYIICVIIGLYITGALD